MFKKSPATLEVRTAIPDADFTATLDIDRTPKKF